MTVTAPQVDDALLSAARLVAERLGAPAGTVVRAVDAAEWSLVAAGGGHAFTTEVDGAWDGTAAILLPVDGDARRGAEVLTDAVHAMALQVGPLVPGVPQPVEVGTLAAREDRTVVGVFDGEALFAALVLARTPSAAAPAPATFRAFGDTEAAAAVDPRRLHLLRDVEMGISVELGRTRMTVQEVLALAPGVVLELDRAAGSPVDVLVNGTLMARGEVVVVDEEFAVRVTEVVNDADTRQRA
jgi:flagellar motor switch protein FliN/FliY